MKLTVFFNGQFWVGLIERTTTAGLLASLHIFGAEPQDEEILAFVNQQLSSIIKTQTAAVPVEAVPSLRLNPKRRAREAAREMKATPVSTKAQEALQSQFEENAQKKQVLLKGQKLEAQEKKWQLRQEKARKKHRGK